MDRDRLPLARWHYLQAATDAYMTLPARKMSALGQKQTFAVHQTMSASPPTADIGCDARRERQF